MTLQGSFRLQNFTRLASSVIVIFSISLGPFVVRNQLPQLLSRLFPFSRGLNHAYWAPNAWALVTALDRVLILGTLCFDLPLTIKTSGMASASRGLVGDTTFGILPEIKPFHTFAATILVQSVVLVKLWTRPNYRSFLSALTLCAYVSFLFGWHVHEKAVLLILLPLSLMANESRKHLQIFLVCSSAGILSVLPLMFTPFEEIVASLYSMIWAVLVFRSLQRHLPEHSAPLINSAEWLYLAGIPLVKVMTWVLPLVLRGSQGPVYEFLPLMLTSTYCALGMCWAFLRLFFLYILSQ